MKIHQLLEMPIEPTGDPNDPTVYGHERANPMSLKGRIQQARAQLKELTELAESDDLIVWERITQLHKGGMFMGLEQNLEQIRHGISELAQRRRKGGVNARGIDKNIGEAKGPAQQAAIAIAMKKIGKKPKGVAEGYSDTTFKVDRRKLNVPALIQKGAILVTHPHGEQGWETDNKEDWAFSLLSLYNVLQGGWPSEAKKYLKPASYKKAEQQVNSSAPNLGSDKLVYDGKYNQILWSIKKLGIPDNVAFLDNDNQGVAEGYTDDDIETTKQFRNAIAGLKAKSAIDKAKDGDGSKYYSDGAKVTPQETARRAAERKAEKDKKGKAEGLK